MRSVANSRTRWATVIDSVLKMTKAPTKRAMKPNASRKYWMMFVNSSMSFCRLLRLLDAGLHLGVRREDRLDLLDELLGRHTLAGGDRDARRASPSLSKSSWASASVKMANVAPPSDSCPANCGRPEIVNSCTGPLATMPIVSPTA